MILEIFGYIGSCLVVISMLMSNVVKLRILNTIGSVISGMYALLCHAYPLVLMNSALIIINLYGFYKLLNTNKEYKAVKTNVNDGLVQYFLKQYKKDIHKAFPKFDPKKCMNDDAYMILCEDKPAGLFIGEVKGDDFYIELDYTTPAYRDCSVGQFIFSELKYTFHLEREVSKKHIEYLEKVGFKKIGQSYIR
ncbi:MAG: hypothetical protein Q4C49_12735 [Bacillota bacterium]|nr:hypothetical protein [Bacillota bacterium]